MERKIQLTLLIKSGSQHKQYNGKSDIILNKDSKLNTDDYVVI